ncbi:hypothetical protein SASPL_134480 [Salvia splendens]|uniref:Uncharacterized protein n=1 Tax=Salvia splendens TaxID=180675 RepID=A0A8X8X4Z0_SALSN|nr:hypothetical protein SASPL_134480 [Salvia splendens]
MDCYHLLSHTYDKQCWNQPPQPVHPRRATCWDLPDCGNLSYGYQQTPTYAPEPYPSAYSPPRQQGYPGYDQPPPRLPTSWDPPGPSCWYPPTPAFEQPSYTYIDSYVPLQIPITGDHREQPDSQPPRLPYTDSESLVQPINCSSGYYPWQLENSPSRQLSLPDLPLHLPSPPLPTDLGESLRRPQLVLPSSTTRRRSFLHTSNLDFVDTTTEIEHDSWDAETCKHVKVVNSVLESHQAINVKHLRISFYVNKSAQSAVAKWLEFVWARQVKRLRLNFHCHSVNHALVLGDSMGGVTRPMKYLKSLSLRSMTISGEDISLFLQNCPLFKGLRTSRWRVLK